MSASLLNGLMNAQSQTATPAGQQMQVVMIPSRNIIPNPDNDEIYTIGNMDGLKDDIQQHGLRQPLEVIPVGRRAGSLYADQRAPALGCVWHLVGVWRISV